MGKAEIIPFEEFQQGIAPLWYASDDPKRIPIYNDPYRIIQYPVAEQRDRVLYFPIRYSEDGVTKCYSSIYNISDRVIRIRGIYVLEGHRGHGVGHRMIGHMTDLFPRTFDRVVGFWRENSYERFIEHSQMSIIPGTGWIWSDFSQVNMRFLYRDRGPRATAAQLEENRDFITRMHAQHGYGGTMNLNRQWTDEEWATFVRVHQGSYPDLGINFDF